MYNGVFHEGYFFLRRLTMRDIEWRNLDFRNVGQRHNMYIVLNRCIQGVGASFFERLFRNEVCAYVGDVWVKWSICWSVWCWMAFGGQADKWWKCHTSLATEVTRYLETVLVFRKDVETIASEAEKKVIFAEVTVDVSFMWGVSTRPEINKDRCVINCKGVETQGNFCVCRESTERQKRRFKKSTEVGVIAEICWWLQVCKNKALKGIITWKENNDKWLNSFMRVMGRCVWVKMVEAHFEEDMPDRLLRSVMCVCVYMCVC